MFFGETMNENDNHPLTLGTYDDTDDIRERIANFIYVANGIIADHWRQMGWTHCEPTILDAEYISSKWCRIVKMEEQNGKRVRTGVYAFIALEYGETKALGVISKGDVHKPASFKAPAKHARGNVLIAPEFAKWLTAYGPAYLK
jgi:hypothetical protein